MEKVIYENETSKLVADANGGVVNLTQYLNGEVSGAVAMFYEEVEVLQNFILEVEKGEQDGTYSRRNVGKS